MTQNSAVFMKRIRKRAEGLNEARANTKIIELNDAKCHFFSVSSQPK